MLGAATDAGVLPQPGHDLIRHLDHPTIYMEGMRLKCPPPVLEKIFYGLAQKPPATARPQMLEPAQA